MNYTTVVMIANPNIRCIKGLYEDGGRATLFKTVDSTIKVDDYVVVESSTRWGLTTVKVIEVDVEPDFDGTEKVRWALDKIDYTRYKEILKMEEDAVTLIRKGENRKKREEIAKNTLAILSDDEVKAMAITKLS